MRVGLPLAVDGHIASLLVRLYASKFEVAFHNIDSPLGFGCVSERAQHGDSLCISWRCRLDFSRKIGAENPKSDRYNDEKKSHYRRNP